MQKKAGQISSNTLGLRFMQNAAKAKQEKEVEAVKARVRSEEEWEVSPSVRQSWGVDDQGAEAQGVIYEQSYLPFLFPGSSSSHPVASESDEEEVQDPPRKALKGRRTFGKHGQEEVEKPTPEPAPVQPSSDGATSLPRGARAISSHGRNASNLQKPRPPQRAPPVPTAPHQAPAPKTTITTAPSGFMKPQVDAPRAQNGERERRKRPSADADGVADGQRKSKKRKEKEALTFGDL